MALREDLVESAAKFLQDPSVATAAAEKRVAFLESRGLTKQEVAESLRRANQQLPRKPENVSSFQQPQPYSTAADAADGYATQPFDGRRYFHPPPPPQQQGPYRDWRDFFVLATLTTSLSVGLYMTFKRYVLPLIAPPAPAQIEQDKAELDAKLDRAFALLSQMQTDTEALQVAERDRAEKLDSAVNRLQNQLTTWHDSEVKRDDRSRSLSDQVRKLQDSVPRALEKHNTSLELRVKDLTAELQSVRKLMAASAASAAASAASAAPVASAPKPAAATVTAAAAPAQQKPRPATVVNPFGIGLHHGPYDPDDSYFVHPADIQKPSNNSAANNTQNPVVNPQQQPASTVDPNKENPLSFLLKNGRNNAQSAAIPAWQLASKPADGQDSPPQQSGKPAAPSTTAAAVAVATPAAAGPVAPVQQQPPQQQEPHLTVHLTQDQLRMLYQKQQQMLFEKQQRQLQQQQHKPHDTLTQNSAEQPPATGMPNETKQMGLTCLQRSEIVTRMRSQVIPLTAAPPPLLTRDQLEAQEQLHQLQAAAGAEAVRDHFNLPPIDGSEPTRTEVVVVGSSVAPAPTATPTKTANTSANTTAASTANSSPATTALGPKTLSKKELKKEMRKERKQKAEEEAKAAAAPKGEWE